MKALLSICLSTVFLISACGGSSSDNDENDNVTPTPPNAIASPVSGSTIFSSAAVSFVFDQSMDTDSLQLGGNMADDSDTAMWSTTLIPNDTLTINPVRGWNAAAGNNALSIEVNDIDGEALAPLVLNYSVILRLENFQPAEVVMGQADFNGTAANGGGATGASGFNLPFGLAAVNDRLYVSDFSNHRVLGYNAIPSVNNQPADFVIGQTDFTSNSPGNSSDAMEGPENLASDGSKLAIAEWNNSRITVFNNLPQAGPASADVVVGQSGFGPPVENCTSTGIGNLEDVIIADGKLIASVYRNNRVLIWNSIPTSNSAPADLVLGQATFTNCAEDDSNQDGSPDSPNASTLNQPAGVWSDGTRLVVAEFGNNRVLIWNSFPTSNFQPADLVLGQSNFSNSAPMDDNQDGNPDATPSNRTFQNPYFVDSNGTQLAIGSWDNNRVMIWNNFPTSNFQPAHVVLGQADFASNTANDDNQDDVTDAQASARTLDGPAAIEFAHNRLLIADNNNHRVLIYEGL